MLKVLFTLDYEIHGNGEGCPHELMVETTARMLDQFDRYGAKLTIMADVAEILKFREYQQQTGADHYHYEAIAKQLQDAVRRGHDVQLHLHSSYFNATVRNLRWEQDWSEYNFARLPFERMREMVRTGKDYLEDLLRPVRPQYSCVAFRAANWAVSPSGDVVRALSENGLRIDTSVFKYGRREGIVNFDYSCAHSNLAPWLADEEDICRHNPQGRLLEMPIYCERRWIGAFLTANRVRRAIMTRFHRIQPSLPAPSGARAAGTNAGKPVLAKLSLLTRRHAWKADFNQCTGRQLIKALLRASRQAGEAGTMPFILIGHSKQFNASNERSLQPFLAYVRARPTEFGFGTFGPWAASPAEPAPGAARHRSQLSNEVTTL